MVTGKKDLEQWPEWINQKSGRPTLMLYSAVDDRSGVAYQQYCAVFGEDVESALRFLFRVMTPKQIEGFPFQGIPRMLCMDNGPIARSQVFQRVMELLGIQVRTHLPKGKDGRRTTARAKAYDVGEMPVSDEIISSVVARDIDDLEPRLTRYGYDTKIIAKALNVRPSVIRSLFRGQLPPGQTQELQKELLAMGLPV